MKNDFFIVLCSIFFATFAVFIFLESRMMIVVTQLNKLLKSHKIKYISRLFLFLTFTKMQFINAVFM